MSANVAVVCTLTLFMNRALTCSTIDRTERVPEAKCRDLNSDLYSNSNAETTKEKLSTQPVGAVSPFMIQNIYIFILLVVNCDECYCMSL
jgi:hypothetical protein